MLYFDSETYSEVPIECGTYRYTSACELMIASYAIDDQPVQVWDRTRDAKMPGDLEYALHDPDELITAHSSMFDRNVVKYALGIDIPIPRWRDTMVKALAHGLPGGLDKLCGIFKVPQEQRKRSGKQLINLFCKPRPPNMKLRRATRATHPLEWADFIAYALADTEAMRVIDHKLPSWNFQGFELELWHLDQIINDRGFCADTELAVAAIRAVELMKKQLADQTNELTNGNVQAATQRDKLLEHILAEYGVLLPDMQMSTLERRIEDQSLPIELRNLLGIRLQATTISTSKYRSVLNGVQQDGRMRGTLQFDGAQRTGRWGGRKFQPHNMPRPDMSKEEIDFAIESFKANCGDLVLDDVMRAASNAIRGCVIAPKGRKLVVGDLSNIEGRSTAWVAGEDWKLKAFTAYDEGDGPDLYKLAYAKSFRVAADSVTKDQRQIGKVQELMLGYQGGVGAYITGAATYGIDLDQMAETSIDTLVATEPEVWAEAAEFWNWTLEKKRPTFGLDRETFMVCDSFKRLWRRLHPRIESLWKDLEIAYATAVYHPGVDHPCRVLAVRRDGAWLRIKLPSGRSLCYPSPQVADNGTLSYMGINQYSKQWNRIGTYGGKLLENVSQALSRDVLAANMPLIEQAGYNIVLTVHDEDVTETPDNENFTAEHLTRLMATQPSWAPGLPLNANGFETYRYRKD